MTRQTAIDLTKGSVPIVSLVGALVFVWTLANDVRDTVDSLASVEEVAELRAKLERVEQQVAENEKAIIRLSVKVDSMTVP